MSKPRRMWAARLALVALILCSVSGRSVLAQPVPAVSAQWKQSIERPSRGWDYDGKRILGHLGEDVCLWDAASGELLHRLKEHKERIQKVQFSPNGQYALSSSWISPGPMTDLKSKDTRTILWNLATGQSSQIFPGQVAGEFSPDGTRIVTFRQRPHASVSFDASVWDVLTGRELLKVTLDDESGPYWDALHFSPDGRHLIYIAHGACLLYNTSTAVCYNASDGRELGRVTANNGIHRYTSAGALACFDSEKASVIDIPSGRVLHSIEHGVKGVWRGAWTHDGSKVAAFPVDGAIQIWDLKSGTKVTGAQGGTYVQRQAIISSDSSRLALEWCGMNAETRRDEPALGLYDMKTGQAIAVIDLPKAGQLIGFSPDSKTLLVIGPEPAIYDAVDGKKVRTLPALVNPRD